MFIHCKNDKCKNYYEDSCMLDLNNKMVSLDINGQCEDFKEGVNEAYQADNSETVITFKNGSVIKTLPMKEKEIIRGHIRYMVIP